MIGDTGLAVGNAVAAAAAVTNAIVDCRWREDRTAGPAPSAPDNTARPPTFYAPLPEGKRHRHHLVYVLPQLLCWVRAQLDSGVSVGIFDDTGDDRAVVVAVAVLTAYWTNAGMRIPTLRAVAGTSAVGPEEEAAHATVALHRDTLSKQTFTQRYQW